MKSRFLGLALIAGLASVSGAQQPKDTIHAVCVKWNWLNHCDTWEVPRALNQPSRVDTVVSVVYDSTTVMTTSPAVASVETQTAAPMARQRASGSVPIGSMGKPFWNSTLTQEQAARLYERNVSSVSAADRGMLNVSCNESMQATMAAFPSLRFEHCADYTDYIRRLTVIDCPSAPGTTVRFARIVGGDVDLVGWRRRCYPGERLWADMALGQAVMSAKCGNITPDLRLAPPHIPIVKEPVLPLMPRVDTVTRVITSPPIAVRKGFPWWRTGIATALIGAGVCEYISQKRYHFKPLSFSCLPPKETNIYIHQHQQQGIR